MRGWEKVSHYADCDIWAKGNQRRLINPETGEVVHSYQMPTGKENHE